MNNKSNANDKILAIQTLLSYTIFEHRNNFMLSYAKLKFYNVLYNSHKRF